MYSIMIVDDEEIILNGISDAIRASRLPLKSIQISQSAWGALERMKENPCDILISDIRMPDMDGLEMVKRAKEIWPGIRVIFLTGYQDFEYARRALRLNSDDYLLKPLPDQKLIEAVENVISILDKIWMEHFEARYYRREECIRGSLKENVPVNLLLIHYGSSPTRMKGEEIHQSLCSMLNKTFSHYCNGVVFEQEEGETFVLLQPSVGKEYWEKACLKVMEEIQSFFLEQLDIVMSIGLSGQIEQSEDSDIKNRMREHLLEIGEYGSLFQYQLKDAKEDNTNYAVVSVKKYIKDNPEKDLSLGMLGERFHMNPSYLSRVFHQETGIPISEYITQIRLDAARFLLEETDMKIYEIAQKTGFDTPGYFTKVFNKTLEISPKNYRINRGNTRSGKEITEK